MNIAIAVTLSTRSMVPTPCFAAGELATVTITGLGDVSADSVRLRLFTKAADPTLLAETGILTGDADSMTGTLDTRTDEVVAFLSNEKPDDSESVVAVIGGTSTMYASHTVQLEVNPNAAALTSPTGNQYLTTDDFAGVADITDNASIDEIITAVQALTAAAKGE